DRSPTQCHKLEEFPQWGSSLRGTHPCKLHFQGILSAIRQCLLCLAPRESRWRPIFRTPAHVSDPIILFHDKSEWLNLLQKIPGLIWNSRNNSGDATERSLIESNFLDGTEVIAGVSMRANATVNQHAKPVAGLASFATRILTKETRGRNT